MAFIEESKHEIHVFCLLSAILFTVVDLGQHNFCEWVVGSGDGAG